MKKIKNIEELEKRLADYARLTDGQNKIQNKLEQERNRLEEKYAPEINENESEINNLFDSIQAFTEAHRVNLFTKDKKSRQLINGLIGFRLDTPSIKTGPDFSLETLRKERPDLTKVKKIKFAPHVRKRAFAFLEKLKRKGVEVSYEPDKTQLKETTEEIRKRYNISYKGDEKFYIDLGPVKEEQNNGRQLAGKKG